MLRVLIVEDEPLISIFLRDLLEDGGHQIVGIANTQDKALLIARNIGEIDVAIMDIDLSIKPDGVDAARRLLLEHSIASLFVSAHLTDTNIERASRFDNVGFISKPFLEDQVTAALAPLDAEPPRLKRSTADQLINAFEDGKRAGTDFAQNATQCPWPPTERRDLRYAWLSGFGQSRALIFKSHDVRSHGPAGTGNT